MNKETQSKHLVVQLSQKEKRMFFLYLETILVMLDTLEKEIPIINFFI